MNAAVGNLVRNAIKFSAAGGQVRLRAKVAGRRLRIEVEDSCGGLQEEEVTHAFSPFVRSHRNTDGYGLGLAIAKRAANSTGGTIRVQNLPGQGCVFVLEVPVRPIDAAFRRA
jgi:signal transduction histidine kinase